MLVWLAMVEIAPPRDAHVILLGGVLACRSVNAAAASQYS